MKEPLADWQKELLDERLDALERDLEGTLSWDEVKASLKASRPNVRQLLASARERLAAVNYASPREAHLLLGHVLGIGEASLLARDDEAVRRDDAQRFEELISGGSLASRSRTSSVARSSTGDRSLSIREC